MKNTKISKIYYKELLPDINDYWKLFETTTWNNTYKFDKSDLKNAIDKSWYAVSVYDNNKLIGFGRIISDGVHHAFIVDMMIDPEYQGQSIGGTVLKKLLDKCKKNNIRDIQLFAAKDKFGFYEKYNFKKRADNAPGMQYQY